MDNEIEANGRIYHYSEHLLSRLDTRFGDAEEPADYGLKISYLSNVLDLHTGETVGGAWTISEGLAVFRAKRDDDRFVEIELLDAAETLLPHLLPDEFGNSWPSWPPAGWAPQVSYDRDRDVLRLFNNEIARTSRPITDDVTIGCDNEGEPVYVEILGAAMLLLPYLLPLSDEVSPRNQEVNP